MSIVIFGGSFDPIHIGHMIIANEVNAMLNPKQFYFVPTKFSPLKSHGPVASDDKRIEMLNAALQHLKFGALLTFEIDRESVSYTYDTVKYIQRIHQNEDIYIIIGEDQYQQLSKWHQIKWLKDNCKFVVINRFQNEMQPLDEQFIFMNMPLVQISSTVIREKIKNHQTCRIWVIDEVLQIIKRGHLYES